MRAFGIVGNCRGKNRLVPRIVAELNDKGMRVSTLKRVGDDVDLDRPGKASHALREAGAREVMIANAFRSAIMTEYRSPDEPEVDALLERMSPVDLVIVEGFHLSPYPKCEIVLDGQDRRPNYPDDPSIVALVTDTTLATSLPQFAPDAVEELAAFIAAAALDTGENPASSRPYDGQVHREQSARRNGPERIVA
ncbi:molybdopterin-guanine dinucleotide biosynthesis protein B [Dongia sp.]|uniref:molybdopterin-guanine dinucleotide biosynthesis protein B n=1 Tax=Dongia sp. TaxID=1977262 RepID=UPI0035B37DD8